MVNSDNLVDVANSRANASRGCQQHGSKLITHCQRRVCILTTKAHGMSSSPGEQTTVVEGKRTNGLVEIRTSPVHGHVLGSLEKIFIMIRARRLRHYLKPVTDDLCL